MENTENKCVIVADEELPVGILANTAAILGMTLGKCLPDCVGEDIPDGSGLMHKGITNIPIPILKGNKAFIRSFQMWHKAARLTADILQRRTPWRRPTLFIWVSQSTAARKRSTS